MADQDTWCNPDGLLVRFNRREKGALECCTKDTPAAECTTPTYTRATNKYSYVETWNTGEVTRGFGPMSVESDSE